MQRFVPRALFKTATPFDIFSVLLGQNGYGRNGYGRNGSGPKRNSHSDKFILKFASVSEFHRHKTDDRKMWTPFLFALISMQRYVAKKQRNASECWGALF